MYKTLAFTLIEILVVATIIIVLTTISIASFSTANKSARDAKRKSDLESIRQAQVLRKTQLGTYETAAAVAGFGMVGKLTNAGYLSPPAPVDPKNGAGLGEDSGESKTGDGTVFCICEDLEIDGKGNHTTGVCRTGAWGSGNFYCVQQPY